MVNLSHECRNHTLAHREIKRCQEGSEDNMFRSECDLLASVTLKLDSIWIVRPVCALGFSVKFAIHSPRVRVEQLFLTKVSTYLI